MPKKKIDFVEEESLPLAEETSLEATEASTEIAEVAEVEAIEEVSIEEKIEEPKPRMAKGDYYSKIINGGN